MGCVCCSLSTFVSIVLHALERISLCTVCALLVCCLLFTILSVLVMGVGIGFHYCEVAHAAEAMANAAKASASLESEGDTGGLGRRAFGKELAKQPLRSVNQAMKRGFAHQLGRRDRADQLMPSNNNTINDIILGRNSTHHEPILRHRAKRTLNLSAQNSVNNKALTFNAQNTTNYTTAADLTFNANPINDATVADLTINVHNMINDTEVGDSSFIAQRSVNETSAFTLSAQSSAIDTASAFTNDSIIYEYYYDKNFTHDTVDSKLSDAPSNVSVYDAKLLRENCTLLNFFTRFLQI